MPERVNILVVDDLQDKLIALQVVLEELGQNVVLAQSGREALRRVVEQDFAVILLDVNMPDMDGFETAALIRRRRQSAHTPIIFITAFGDDLHTARGYSLGAVDYILSPVIPEILRTKVSVFVELYRKTEEVKRHVEERVELARAQAARVAAEATTRRFEFLAAASKVLSGSLNVETLVTGLARLVVPYFGKLGAVVMGGDQADKWSALAAWVGPGEDQIDHAALAPGSLSSDLAEALLRVFRYQKTEDFCLEEPLAGVLPADAKSRSECGAMGHGMLIPLSARGHVLGVLLTARGGAGRPFSPEERAVAEDLAGRAAISLDNARLYEEIQEADQRKNEFLAMLAHELRNPLAPIRNAVHILRRGKGAATDEAWARDVIDRQTQHLVRLVDDLLDVSRITRGKIQLQKEVVEIAPLVARAIETSRPEIDHRGHELTVVLPTEPIHLFADPTRLAQVLTNLLNNAAKYTEPGGRIDLEVAQANGQAVIRVRDSGIGMPGEMIDHVFDLFFQADRSLDRSQGGLGIGLTMVRRLVEMHGGSVHAASAGPNQGSEFVLRLPTVHSQPEIVATPSTAVPLAGACRVLIVDDNCDAAQSLSLVLEHAAYKTRVAHSAAEALSICESFRPDVALLDIGLPETNGYELAQRMRAQPWSENTAFVAITGYGQERDKRRAEEAGFEHHLVKPVAPDRVLGLLATLAGNRPMPLTL